MHDVFIKIIQVHSTTDKRFKLVSGLWILRQILIQAGQTLQQHLNIITSSSRLAQAIKSPLRVPSYLHTLQQDCIHLLRSTPFQLFSFGAFTESLLSFYRTVCMILDLFLSCINPFLFNKKITSNYLLFII